MRLSYRSFALLLSTAAATSSSATSTRSTFSRLPIAAFVNQASRHSISLKKRNFSNSAPVKMSASTSDNSSNNDSNQLLRIALCQFHVTPDKASNHKTATDYVGRAAAQGAQLVVLPEIWNSPYATSAFGEYAEAVPKVGDSTCDDSKMPSSSLLMAQAKQHKLWIVGGSIPEHDGDKVYNTCIVYNPSGKVVAKHRKVHLFDIDVPGGITFKESDTLTAGDTLTTFSLEPTMDCLVGVGICYDIRFALQAALMCSNKDGCKLLIYPGAFNLTTGPAHWELLQRARALDNQCFVATASPARSEPPATEGKYPHYTAWGHSTIVSPWGDVVKKADEKEALVVCDIDLKRVEEVRNSIPIMKQKRSDLYRLEQVTTNNE